MTPRVDLQEEGDRGLCVIARADGHVSEAEMAVIKDIGAGRGRPRTGELCARLDLERVRIVSAIGGLVTADLHPSRVYPRITFSALVESSGTFATGC